MQRSEGVNLNLRLCLPRVTISPRSAPLPARRAQHLSARTSRRALRTYCPAATTASPRLIQKQASGHHVPSLGDEHEADRRVQPPGGDLPEPGDLELVAARHDELVAADEEEVAQRG